MRKFMMAAALVSACFATPALARDGSAYVGIDAGVQSPSSLRLRFTNSNVSIPNAVQIKHKLGYDVDAVFGYDFGMFRVEGELGYKHADFKHATVALAAPMAKGDFAVLVTNWHGCSDRARVAEVATSIKSFRVEEDHTATR